MEVIIEADITDLNNLIDEYKQNHIDNFNPDECKKYVRRKIIDSVLIEEAYIKFFFNGGNYVTW